MMLDNLTFLIGGFNDLPFGKHTKSYSKLLFIVDSPIKNAYFPYNVRPPKLVYNSNNYGLWYL